MVNLYVHTYTQSKCECRGIEVGVFTMSLRGFPVSWGYPECHLVTIYFGLGFLKKTITRSLGVPPWRAGKPHVSRLRCCVPFGGCSTGGATRSKMILRASRAQNMWKWICSWCLLEKLLFFSRNYSISMFIIIIISIITIIVIVIISIVIIIIIVFILWI